jgi:hypothetical protein
MISWDATKAAATTLVFGLVAGPIIANAFGWTMWAGAARAQLRASVVEQSSLLCAEQVRNTAGQTGDMDFPARTKLADDWARGRGAEKPDAEITQACAFKLAN